MLTEHAGICRSHKQVQEVFVAMRPPPSSSATTWEAGFSYESERGLAVPLPSTGVAKECFWMLHTQTALCTIQWLFLEHC